MADDLLFCKYNIFDVLESQKAAVRKDVEELAPDYVLKVSEADCVATMVARFRLNVPVLLEDQIHAIDPRETRVDVSHRFDYAGFEGERVEIPGTITTVVIPFEGDADFLSVRPQTFSLSPPRGEVAKDEVRFNFLRTDNDAAALKRDYERSLTEVNECLASLRESEEQFNAALPALVTNLFQKRKQRLLGNAGMVASLGIPIQRRSGQPATYAVPIQRKQARIEMPKVQAGSFKPEPELPMSVYEDILGILKNMVRVMELSPGAFSEMGEEDLRTHFLVQLNAQYEGQATGETFNYQGKTDILIRAEGRNAFIAECKFWRGEKALLRYDRPAALLLKLAGHESRGPRVQSQ
ncbi:MAG: hypothetical protein HY235_29170 [Acidobacteria bacterium]|nr:hypothetical protein [Acidobacteriota bacterium]